MLLSQATLRDGTAREGNSFIGCLLCARHCISYHLFIQLSTEHLLCARIVSGSVTVGIKKSITRQKLLTSDSHPPQDIWQCLEMFLVVTTCDNQRVGAASVIQCVEAMDALNDPTVHRPSFATKAVWPKMLVVFHRISDEKTESQRK